MIYYSWLMKISIVAALCTTIAVASNSDENVNTYFNDELNGPPPQMETFNSYEEMRKYLEDNSNVELIDNPTFDTYLSAYNLHHKGDDNLKTSESQSVKKRMKRDALAFPYDFIKFELSDAREPDEITKQLLRRHRERESKSMKAGEEEPKEVASDDETTKLVKTDKSTANSTKTVKRRRVTRTKPKHQLSSTIKRSDTDPYITGYLDDEEDDMSINESQNVHYYAAVPASESLMKHKIQNVFPQEVHKAIDFVLGEKKQAPASLHGGSAGGKTGALKLIHVPLYHKQAYYAGDKFGHHQAAKVSNKFYLADYGEALNKYLHAYSLPLQMHINDFNPPAPALYQKLPEPQTESNADTNAQLYHFHSHSQEQYQPAHHYYEANTNSLPLHEYQQQQQQQQPDYSQSLDTQPTPTSHPTQHSGEVESEVDIASHTQTYENEASAQLNTSPEINQLHTIPYHPQAHAYKVLPAVKYVFHQDIAHAPVASAPLKSMPEMTAAIHSSSNDASKEVQTYEVEKPSPSNHASFKSHQHQHYHHVYAPVHFQNEMLTKAMLINQGYKFDDLKHSAAIEAQAEEALKGGGGNEAELHKEELNDLKELNENYQIKSTDKPAAAYIESTTAHYYYPYAESTTAAAHQHDEAGEHQHLSSAPQHSHYILKEKPSSSESDSYLYKEKESSEYEGGSLNYKDLSALIGKSSADQMHGITYLIEKQLQTNKAQAKMKATRPQDNRSPILFHPEQKNGGDALKGKKVYINEYGFKEIRNDNSASSGGSAAMPSSTVKPIKEDDMNSVVHITPHPPPAAAPSHLPPAKSYNEMHSLSPNYKYGTKLYGPDGHGLQYASKYAFGYRVRDFYTGNDFGHKQKRDRDGVTRGEYHILLPDGRVQNVRYTADDTGFHADVSFESGP